jgi:tetratricopeptide (TPR) repeat protein
MASKGIDKLSNELALEKIDYLIDACEPSRRSAGITRALEWCDALEARGLAPIERAELDYFRANAWDQRRPRRSHQRAEAWRWEQPALQEEILCLRRARIGEGFNQLHPIRRCQLLTNLANQFSTAGRMVEALELWSEALAIEPNFWMARGNRGSGFSRYARSLYSQYYASAIFLEAHKDLVRAIDDAATHWHFGFPDAREYFEREKAWIDARVDIAGFADRFAPDDGALGTSQAERRYRHWCLTN